MESKGESVQVVQHGQIYSFDSTECTVATRNDRKFLQYRGGRFKLLIKGCRALYGVAAHSKYEPKLSLIVSNNAIVAAFSELSDRVKRSYDLGVNNAFKPFLLNDEKTGVKKLVIKIKDDLKTSDGKRVQGGINADDICSVLIDTSIYHYGQYFGHTHKLLAIKTNQVNYNEVL